jgi:hypothetical protein
MPIEYQRDDQRRLVTLLVTEPYSIDEVVAVVDRQVAEDLWAYAMLYDLRGGAHMLLTETDLQQLAVRVKAVGPGRGPVGLAIGNQSQWGLIYTEKMRRLVTLEVLLTPEQVDGWLDRNAPHRKPKT